LGTFKVFTAKNKLPAVQDYKSTANNDFWAAFPYNSKQFWGPRVYGPWQTRSSDRARLEAVCRDLENGADNGCRGDSRNASFSTNAPSAHDSSEEVTDAVATWVEQGIVAGLFDPISKPKNVKIYGVMC
jgi:hypothetical protein